MLANINSLNLSRCVLSTCAAALLAGCGGSQPPIGVPGAMPIASDVGQAATHSATFKYTGTRQWFRVPANLTRITVVAVGAAGAGTTGGLGGRVRAIIPVTPGERLAVYVGGAASSEVGGFNGGGDAGFSDCSGSCNSFAGGGASDVREHGVGVANRILVAGGGGGEGSPGIPSEGSGTGGKGGGSVGGAGGYAGGSSAESSGGGGRGGTQKRGGSGGKGGKTSDPSAFPGSPGDRGGLGVGGNGGAGGGNGGGSGTSPGGGGGGGGYYGGGGGGGGAGSYFLPPTSGGGGGGGSSYIEPRAYAYRSWRGWKLKTANGLVVFDW